MPMTIVSDCDGGDFDDSLCDNLSVPLQYYLTTTAFVVSLRGCGGGGGVFGAGRGGVWCWRMQSNWRWSDQANTYRPPGATYDRDCGVVIKEFDHTCPWTVRVSVVVVYLRIGLGEGSVGGVGGFF